MKIAEKESLSRSSCGIETNNLQSSSDSEDDNELSEDCLSTSISPLKSDTSADNNACSDGTSYSALDIENTDVELHNLSISGYGISTSKAIDTKVENPLNTLAVCSLPSNSVNVIPATSNPVLQTCTVNKVKTNPGTRNSFCSRFFSSNSPKHLDLNKSLSQSFPEHAVLNNFLPHEQSVLNSTADHTSVDHPVSNSAILPTSTNCSSVLNNVVPRTFIDCPTPSSSTLHASSKLTFINNTISHGAINQPASNIATSVSSSKLPVLNHAIHNTSPEHEVSNNSVADTAPEVSNNSVADTAPEVSNNSVADTAPEVSNNSVADTAPEVSNNSVADPAPEVSNNSVADTAPEVSNNSVADTAPEVSNNSVADTAPEVSNNSVADIAPEVSNNSVADTCPKVSNNSVADTCPEVSNNLVAETCPEISNNSADDTCPEVSNNSVADISPENPALNNVHSPTFSECPELNVVVSHTFLEHPDVTFSIFHQTSLNTPVLNATLFNPFSELPVLNITHSRYYVYDPLPTLLHTFSEFAHRSLLHINLNYYHPGHLVLHGFFHNSSDNPILTITLSHSFSEHSVFYNDFHRIVSSGQPSSTSNAIPDSFRGHPVLNEVFPQIANPNCEILGDSSEEPQPRFQSYSTQPIDLDQSRILQYPSAANSYHQYAYSSNNFNALYPSARQLYPSQPFSNIPTFSPPAYHNQPAYSQSGVVVPYGSPMHPYPAQYNDLQFHQQANHSLQVEYHWPEQVGPESDTDQEVHTDTDQEVYTDTDTDQGIYTDTDQGEHTDQEAHADQ